MHGHRRVFLGKKVSRRDFREKVRFVSRGYH